MDTFQDKVLVSLHNMTTSLDLIYRFIYDHAQVKDSSAYPMNLLEDLKVNIDETKKSIENIKKI